MTLPALVPAGTYPSGLDPDAVEAAADAVRGYCGWHIAPEVDDDLTLDGPGGHVLFLPSLHVVSVSEVTNGGAAVDDPEWSDKGMIRLSCSRWTCRWRGVQVKMTHGYSTCPEAVARVVVDMAKVAAATGASSLQSGPFGVTYGANSSAAQAGAVGLSAEQRRVLDRYKLPSRP